MAYRNEKSNEGVKPAYCNHNLERIKSWLCVFW